MHSGNATLACSAGLQWCNEMLECNDRMQCWNAILEGNAEVQRGSAMLEYNDRNERWNAALVVSQHNAAIQCCKSMLQQSDSAASSKWVTGDPPANFVSFGQCFDALL